MQPIVAPINIEDSGPQVANLQDALRLLLDRGVVRSVEPPNRPTAEELAKLKEGLAEERAQSAYGKVTQRLVMYVQLQEGLGEGLGGAVEEKTAVRLNEILKRLGALVDDEPWVVKGIVRAGGKPRADVKVTAYDRDLRTRQRLGVEALTD